MYCNKCGEKIQEDSKFCPFCGKRQSFVNENICFDFFKSVIIKWKKQLYCFIVWFLSNTLFCLLLGSKESYGGFDKYLICTFIAPALLILARIGVKYLLNKGYNVFLLQILSIVIGFIPVFLLFPLAIVGELPKDFAPYFLLLVVICTELFFLDIFKQKKNPLK